MIADDVEDAVAVQQLDVVDRLVAGVVQLREVEARQLPQIAHAQHRVGVVDVEILVEAELGGEHAAVVGADAGLHLETDDGGEAAVAQLGLDHLHQIVGALFAAFGVGVAGHPEQLDRGHVHAREQVGEAVGHDVLEQDELVVVADPQEARHAAAHRHLDPGHRQLPLVREAQGDEEVDRQVGDEGERMRRVHRQRRHQREDVFLVVVLDQRPLVGGQLVERHDTDLLPTQVGQQFHVDLPLLPAELGNDDAALVELLAGRPAIDAELVDAGADLLLQAADALHEELVHVAGGDGEELDPFEQDGALVAGFVENAEVELQPGQFAVEVKLGRAQIDPARFIVRRLRLRRCRCRCRRPSPSGRCS